MGDSTPRVVNSRRRTRGLVWIVSSITVVIGPFPSIPNGTGRATAFTASSSSSSPVSSSSSYSSWPSSPVVPLRRSNHWSRRNPSFSQPHTTRHYAYGSDWHDILPDTISNVAAIVSLASHTAPAAVDATGTGTGTTGLPVSTWTLPVVLASSMMMVLLKPAMEHTQPLWGAPDPYLAAGTSIAPTAKALSDMGIDVVPGKGGVATTTATMASWPELAQKAVADGVSVLDQSALTREAVLPGFTATGTLLPIHNTMVPLETPATFAAQVEWAAAFLNVVDKLPLAVFVYALVEFFILRPNLDLYKEDIEANPGPVVKDTMVVFSVRLAMFTVVAAVTTTFFG